MESEEHGQSTEQPSGAPLAPSGSAPGMTQEQIAAMVREEMKKFDGVTTELERARQQLTELSQWREGVMRSVSGDDHQRGGDPDTEFFRAPTQQLQQFGRQLVAQIEERNVTRDWWRDFWAENRDLANAKWLVEGVLQDDDEISKLPFTAASATALATAARKRGLELMKQFQGHGNTPGSITVLPGSRGGGGRTQQQTEESAEEPIRTLTSQLTALHQKRMKRRQQA